MDIWDGSSCVASLVFICVARVSCTLSHRTCTHTHAHIHIQILDAGTDTCTSIVTLRRNSHLSICLTVDFFSAQEQKPHQLTFCLNGPSAPLPMWPNQKANDIDQILLWFLYSLPAVASAIKHESRQITKNSQGQQCDR